MEYPDKAAREELAIDTNRKSVAGAYKRWAWDPYDFYSIKFLNMFVTMTRSDGGAIELEFSALTSTKYWRADVFMTITLVDSGGANFAQYVLPEPVHAFCGDTPHARKLGVSDPGHFDRAQGIILNFKAPDWAKC